LRQGHLSDFDKLALDGPARLKVKLRDTFAAGGERLQRTAENRKRRRTPRPRKSGCRVVRMK
jgi:hypothetical protein